LLGNTYSALAENPVALAGQTGGAIRVVLDFLFLLHQGKRKSILKEDYITMRLFV
jgi:hypothetical protein